MRYVALIEVDINESLTKSLSIEEEAPTCLSMLIVRPARDRISLFKNIEYVDWTWLPHSLESILSFLPLPDDFEKYLAQEKEHNT